MSIQRVVIEEVDSFLFRPHLSTRARYYAAVFLNQIVLSNRGDEPVIAAKLINLYFALFQTVTTGEPKEDYDQKTKKGKQPDKRRKESGQSKKKEVQFSIVAEADSRILSALLTGVNRAFPYVAADDVDVIIEEHTPVLFRLVYTLLSTHSMLDTVTEFR
jgi:ribosome biogenesis protein MAK21